MGAYPLLAQLGEQWTVVPRVRCSIHLERTFSSIAQLVERATVNREVIGSNPVGRAIINELKITITNSGKRCPLLPKYCFIL